jgi:hypothetical protein
MLKRTIFLVLALAALFDAYFVFARPWFLTWGSTPAERTAVLPGDEIVPYAASQTTRAITVHAPASVVWAWVAQTGQDRAGFYSYDVLENLVGCEMPRIEQLVPAMQHWKLGDRLWMYPPRKLDGVGGAELRTLVPGRALGFATRQIGTPRNAPEDASWTFVVLPIDAESSRLIARGRGAPTKTTAALISAVTFEAAHYVMERRMLRGIARLAERGPRISPLQDAVQVTAWTLVFAAFVTSAVLVVLGRQPLRRWLTFLLAGLLFQALTLLQPSAWLGLLLAAGMFAAMFAPLPARLLRIPTRRAQTVRAFR